MTLPSSQVFFRFKCRFSARPARGRALGLGGECPPANPPPKIAMPQLRVRQVCSEPTRAGSCPCRNPGLLAACGDLPHFGYVRNTSTLTPDPHAAAAMSSMLAQA